MRRAAGSVVFLFSICLTSSLPAFGQKIERKPSLSPDRVEELTALVQSNHRLAAGLYAQLRDSVSAEGNLLFAPGSAATVLETLLTAEQGDTEAEIRKSLNLQLTREQLEKVLPQLTLYLKKEVNEPDRLFLGLQIEQSAKEVIRVKSVALGTVASGAGFLPGDRLLWIKTTDPTADARLIRSAADFVQALDEAVPILRVRCQPLNSDQEVTRILYLPPSKKYSATPARWEPQLRTAGALWMQDGFSPPQRFGEFVSQTQGNDIYKIDFKDAKERIRSWFSEQLQPERKATLPKEFPGTETRFAFTDAVLFKPNWARGVQQGESVQMLFSLGDTTARIRAVPLTGRFRTAKTDEFQSVEIPCSGGIAMVFLLPIRPADLPVVEKKLTADALPKWFGAGSFQETTVRIPEMDLTSLHNLRGPLAGLGMSGLVAPAKIKEKEADGKPSAASILHQTQLRILPKEGKEVVKQEGPAAPLLVNLDRPFLCLVYDRRTKAILVLGRIVDPR